MNIYKFILISILVSELILGSYCSSQSTTSISSVKTIPNSGWRWSDPPQIDIYGSFNNSYDPDNYQITLTNINNNKTSRCEINEIRNSTIINCNLYIQFENNSMINISIVDNYNYTSSNIFKFIYYYPNESIQSMEFNAADSSMAIYGQFNNRSYSISIDSQLCKLQMVSNTYLLCKMPSNYLTLNNVDNGKSKLIIYDEQIILINDTFETYRTLISLGLPYISKVYDVWQNSTTVIVGMFSEVDFPVDLMTVNACGEIYQVYPKNRTTIVITLGVRVYPNCRISVVSSNEVYYNHSYLRPAEDSSSFVNEGSHSDHYSDDNNTKNKSKNQIAWYIWYLIGVSSTLAVLTAVGLFARYLYVHRTKKTKSDKYGKFNDAEDKEKEKEKEKEREKEKEKEKEENSNIE
ncbi:hypothetical protein PPL_06335 [Heterostelium album PN500]|uniref:Uncharacterized protein n=1 Tax=Heterostelium pallidum (strain ATCC 26659 / Pp 5 / PN500) TaxID=670386 RepID=D3BCV7_HETP5|nr:hypothetical protein PPL_06335 [Heterostelium album PN500]EFA80749.1 hypothetical protein PPL_06335 [Heterostelium album PN500]|eukprot:XP_020432869.1 hypothetical protein PPL_06335 [Heterostelium album PN500]